jgi:hypothetical protein
MLSPWKNQVVLGYENNLKINGEYFGRLDNSIIFTEVLNR